LEKGSPFVKIPGTHSLENKGKSSGIISGIYTFQEKGRA
jgi:hypothetical protein